MGSREIDEGKEYLGFEAARALVAEHLAPLPAEEIPLGGARDRILAAPAVARVDSPAADVALKDGFAVRAADVAAARTDRPAVLAIAGEATAGVPFAGSLAPGCAVRVTTGSALPAGADAVLAVELTVFASPREVTAADPILAGRNVLARGTDVARGAATARPGERLGPGRLGLIAAAGVDRVRVHRLPRVGLVAVGDEIVAPGAPLGPGQLYASNAVTIAAWLARFGCPAAPLLVADDEDALERAIATSLADNDALLTMGGIWDSHRDLVLHVLERMGWRRVFRRVRIGPGKGVALGLLDGKPVFCLPGGPPSCETAFLVMALPGLLRMAGWTGPPFSEIRVRLAAPLRGRHLSWTHFVRAVLSRGEGEPVAVPDRSASRLASMAAADCLVIIPAGVQSYAAGDLAPALLLGR